MDLAVIGAGHVGLVTSACFAQMGHRVIGVDKEHKVTQLREVDLGLYEPGLEEMVRRQQKEGRLIFTSSIGEAVKASQVIFITVGTPSNPDGSADVSSVEEVAQLIARHLEEYRLIVEKSTVPVRTGEWLKRTLRLYNTRGVEFDVASVPEFLREGSAIKDFLHPDRVVLGVESPRAERLLRELFGPLGAPLVVTDIRSAELIKHASNCFLAMKISYINTIASIAEKVGADVDLIARGVGLDHRIGQEFLQAGIGYGGSCFPKDVAAFIRITEELGYDFRLLKEVEEINRGQRLRLVRKVKEALWVLRNKEVAVLGLAFKPNTDDIRDSPSIGVVQLLVAEGARVRATDPVAIKNARQVLGESVRFCQDPYEAAEGAHALVIVTDWDEYKDLDLARLKAVMAIPVIVDGRNVLEPQVVRAAGFEYYGVGR
ncbi:MAG: UDP-glucose/GDP-mannose dehydrogenase family protein [Chloroflexi bacterium]|nr:UDP-glucose/GDP-mannose dehydrogenase family protein [Chloroflexota bacterium]